jgi:hypothetical protein
MTANFRRSGLVLAIGVTCGCMPRRVPVKNVSPTPGGATMPMSTMPVDTQPAMQTTTGLTPGPSMGATISPSMQPSTVPSMASPVATSELGTVTTPTPGLRPKKPFVKLPEHFSDQGNPSVLLMEHVSMDSPVPLSEFGGQPVRKLKDFHLHAGMTADEVKQTFGQPAAIADEEDSWLVYRLDNTRELWLRFDPPEHGRLVAGDVVRGAESGYVRTHVFTAP